MDGAEFASTDRFRDVPRRFVNVNGRAVHYRIAGDGPAVVMLHDSPRSSRLHLDIIRHLSTRFRVVALDTPGYGNSDPLDQTNPEIDDFGDALGAALDALGLSDAPLYATHTSAKIALAHAARSRRTAPLILDGLSIPLGPPDAAFIDRYMRPFVLDGTGAYLTAEWTRMRDMVRWFPWFDQRPETRMAVPMPSDEWLSDYVIDFFSAGPSYSSAYAAAMRYDPLPALRDVACPTLIAAKADDVLYVHLERVPVDDNAALKVERLPADRHVWQNWLEETFVGATKGTERTARAASAAQPERGAAYVELSHGPMLTHSAGPTEGQPLLILDAPTTLYALRWQEALPDLPTIVPQLPGFGESAPRPSPTLESAGDALIAMLDASDISAVDVLATGYAVPLAAVLAARNPGRIDRVILDGCFEHADKPSSLCPEFPFDPAGGHVLRYWHMLRDMGANWPWHDGDTSAVRRIEPVLDPVALHRALTDILKQPDHYGDIMRAVCNTPESALYPRFSQTALVFDYPGDPAYGAAEVVAAALPAAVKAPRAPTTEQSAISVLSFLDGESRNRR